MFTKLSEKELKVCEGTTNLLLPAQPVTRSFIVLNNTIIKSFLYQAN